MPHARPATRPDPAAPRQASHPRAFPRAAMLAALAACLALVVAPAPPLAEAPADEGATRPGAEDAGGLFAREDAGGRTPLPLLATAYRVDVTGIVARGTVTQTYRNETGRTIEAIYAFPLADGAAVDDLELRIGTRRIVGVIREKAQARAEYRKAKSEGRKAALLEQRCTGCFRVDVSGINPGEEVEVVVRWRQEAAYDGGTFRLAVPLTATPRYAPRVTAGAGLIADAVARGPGGGAADEADFTFADARSPLVARAALSVAIDAGVDLDVVESPTHEIDLGFEGRRWLAETRGDSLLANREFVLEWTLVTGRDPVAAIFVDPAADPGGSPRGERHGLVTIVPPRALFDAPALPARTLFVIDVSGSMAGPSIRQARAALVAALERLGPSDTFNVLAFNHEQALLAPRFLDARGADLELGLRFARGLGAGGGTEIYAALEAAIEHLQGDPGPEEVVRRVLFLTDGAVADRQGRLSGLVGRLGDARLHVIGLGHAPNRPLLRQMSALGRGLAEFVAPGASTENRIDVFFERLDRPVLADVRLEIDGVAPGDLLPSPLPDLHAGEPLVASFRLQEGAVPTAARLTARGADGELVIDVPLAETAAGDGGLGARWAARRVRGLLDAAALGTPEAEIRPAVVAIATRFRLVTPFTSLVAVEELPTADEAPLPLRLALAKPAGGGLPQGGTAGPLAAFVGTVLLAFAGLLFGVASRPRRTTV